MAILSYRFSIARGLGLLAFQNTSDLPCTEGPYTLAQQPLASLPAHYQKEAACSGIPLSY